MNLVRQIVDQLSGDTLNRLGSLLGMDAETTGYTASAAVPTLLASLAGMASREDGAKRLAGTLGNIDTSQFGDFAELLDGDANGLMKQGANLLGSLFGEDRLAGLASAIGNYAGLSGSTTKSLLAYLLPLVLAKVAQYWKSKGGTPQALMNLFTEQRANIADAVPTGFSLGDVSGLDQVMPAAVGASRKATETAARSSAGWVIPLALLLLAGFFLWQMMQNRRGAEQATERGVPATDETTAMKPVVPETLDMPAMTQTRDELTGIFDSLNTILAGIRDAASAEAVAPQLEQLNQKIDALGTTWPALPEAGRNTLQQFIADQLGSLKTKVMDTLAIQGLSDRIRTLINQIVRKLEDLHGAQSTS